MSRPSLLKSRRSFLKSGLILSGAAAAGIGRGMSIHPDNMTIVRQLISYLQYHQLADRIGEHYLDKEKHLKNLSLEQMTDVVLHDAGLKRDQLTYLTLIGQLETYRQKVHEEFANEKIVFIDGWVISETEAHLCSLLYFYDHKKA